MLMFPHEYISQCYYTGSIFRSLAGYNEVGNDQTAYDKSSPTFPLSLSSWVPFFTFHQENSEIST